MHLRVKRKHFGTPYGHPQVFHWGSRWKPLLYWERCGSTLLAACWKNGVFNMHSIGFQLRATEPEWKSALKRQKVLCLCGNPSQCALQVSGNKLQQVEKKKYLGPRGGIHEWQDGARRLIHGLVKQTRFCVSFIDLRWHNRSIQTLQSCQSIFVPILTYGHESWVMTGRIQAAEMEFLGRVPGVNLRD